MQFSPPPRFYNRFSSFARCKPREACSWAKAVQRFKKIIFIRGDSMEKTLHVPDDVYFVAQCMLNHGRYHEAARCFRALKDNRGLDLCAQGLREQNRFEDAEKIYQE